MKSLFFVMLLFPGGSAWAGYEAKEGNVSAIFGPFAYKTNYKAPPTEPKSPLMGDLGLIVLGDINEKGSLEIAMFHMNKIFMRRQGDLFTAEQTQAMHITMGYRRWFSPYLSLSLALYSAYAMDEPTIYFTQFSHKDQIDTSARDVTEYGFDLSLQTELWGQGPWAVILDTRYAFSVTSKQHESADHYGALVGIRYLVQERIPPPEKRKNLP